MIFPFLGLATDGRRSPIVVDCILKADDEYQQTSKAFLEKGFVRLLALCREKKHKTNLPT
jgi:hypothetical protein